MTHRWLQLTISPRTAEKHIERIKQKLGVSRRSDLIRLLSDEG